MKYDINPREINASLCPDLATDMYTWCSNDLGAIGSKGGPGLPLGWRCCRLVVCLGDFLRRQAPIY